MTEDEEPDEPRRAKVKVRLRGLEWFPLPEKAEARHAAPYEFKEGEEAFFAAAYLLSIVGLPLTIAFAGWNPIDMPEPAYGVPVALTGALPWFMTEALCELAGRRSFSFFALRTQLWVQFGGATPAAIRRLRSWKRGRPDDGPPSL
ncbi:hypothetical protein GCM10009789_81810 [Kribbella sancticallisti]|uniref:TcpE family protein n=1 Tax=Kribbella sancticallisti TaxID=460087 RepID=A0ABP4QM25_9ACTN